MASVQGSSGPQLPARVCRTRSTCNREHIYAAKRNRTSFQSAEVCVRLTLEKELKLLLLLGRLFVSGELECRKTVPHHARMTAAEMSVTRARPTRWRMLLQPVCLLTYP